MSCRIYATGWFTNKNENTLTENTTYGRINNTKGEAEINNQRTDFKIRKKN